MLAASSDAESLKTLRSLTRRTQRMGTILQAEAQFALTCCEVFGTPVISNDPAIIKTGTDS